MAGKFNVTDPVKKLVCAVKLMRFGRFAIEDGILPTNRLFDKSTFARVVMSPIEEGIVPKNRLPDKSKVVKFFKLKIFYGMDPESRLFPRFMDWRLSKFPKEGEISPVRAFALRIQS